MIRVRRVCSGLAGYAPGACAVIMVWAWMLGSAGALGTRKLWFGHGCTGDRMLSECERNCRLGMDAPVIAHTQIKHERHYGLGRDAPVSGCSRNTNVILFGHGCTGSRTRSNINDIMVRAWMQW